MAAFAVKHLLAPARHNSPIQDPFYPSIVSLSDRLNFQADSESVIILEIPEFVVTRYRFSFSFFSFLKSEYYMPSNRLLLAIQFSFEQTVTNC